MDNPQTWLELITGVGFPIGIILIYILKVRPDENKRSDDREAKYQSHADADRVAYQQSLKEVADTCTMHMKTITDAHDKAFNILSQNIRDNTDQMRRMADIYSRARVATDNGNLTPGVSHEQRVV